MRHRFAAGEGTQHTARHASLVWRAPKGPKGLAVVPVGGGRAWPDNESTRRAKLAARAPGPDGARAAAHGRTKQPGPRMRKTPPRG